MYARSISKNMDLAIAYFQIAASQQNIDALYKLGIIYLYGIDTTIDKELGWYYLNEALQNVYKEDVYQYPSIFLTIAKNLLNNDNKSLEMIYEYLCIAKAGFDLQIENGATFYKNAYEKTCQLLSMDCFDCFDEE